MAKQRKEAVTPRLRFPEFRHHVGFDPTALGRAFGQITNGKANAQDHEESGAFPLFDRSEVIKASSKFAFDSEAVILPGEGMSFRPRYFEGKFDLHQRAYALMECQGHGKYFYYALDHAKAELALKAVKSTVLSLRLPIIESFVVYAPSESAEQQKIADCLTSLDQVIAAQGRNVEALKAHKRGLMQQLFPREGETRPRLRFPEFRNAPEWKRTTLNRVCDMQAGKFVSASEISDEPGEGTYSCYGGNGLRGFTKSFTHSGVFPLIGRQGALCGNVQFAKGEFHATEHALVATPQAGVNVTWLYYTLGKLELNKYATGQAQPGLSVDVLKSVECSVPATETEQQRIADCLSSLDTQITAETNHLAALKTHKQGLMQQLFPVAESVAA